jgi:hypothetical protein
MPLLSSSSMLASRSRKLCQSPSTSPAVHTVRACTEPKSPAPFTYLQIHAQVVHFVPFQSVLLPRRASMFFNGRVGSPKLLWNAVRLPLRSAGSVGQGDSLHLSFASVRCRTLGKIDHPVSSPTRLRTQSSSSAPCSEVSGRSTASIPYWESLKVIAFDKSTVNRNLSSGKLLSYIPR